MHHQSLLLQVKCCLSKAVFFRVRKRWKSSLLPGVMRHFREGGRNAVLRRPVWSVSVAEGKEQRLGRSGWMVKLFSCFDDTSEV